LKFQVAVIEITLPYHWYTCNCVGSEVIWVTTHVHYSVGEWNCFFTCPWLQARTKWVSNWLHRSPL